LILDLIPNPSSGIFSILNPKSVNLTSVVVLDSKGSQILKYATQPQILDLEKYPNGLYSVLIYTDQGVYSKKIIKMD
ncbi:MAG: T9SS type A sorting domain-containing protein, partial [Bacteroidia bacterium]|nr:T9SS type A sorting domain-containing protein [Bacteroidia bacterium]